MSLDVLLLRDEKFLEHDPGPDNPETARRLQAVYDWLDEAKPAGTRTSTPRAATRAELERIHSDDYVRYMESTAGKPRVVLDYDTATSPESHTAARCAAGAAIQAAEEVFQGNARSAFALVRPPGHHAESAKAMGFCLFNNVAVAAEHAVRELGCKRVLILDPDVHHGNGTQNAFYDRSDVLFVSSHRYPFYPGTGAATEVGAGAGAGYTLNLPLPKGLGDADFYHLYDRIVGRVVHQYEPDFILVSAGFDTWQNDPLGGMKVTGDGYRALFDLFRQWSDRFCPRRLVAVLEGGYDPAGNVAAVGAALETMTAEKAGGDPPERPPSEAAREVARQVASAQAAHWPDLTVRN